jgi:hypothetical protein
MDSAILTDYTLGFVSTVIATIIGIANSVEAVRHNSIECERIGSIGFGIGDGMADGVVVLGGFHRLRLRGLRNGLT